MSLTIQASAEVALFDYGQLDPAVAFSAKATAERFRTHLRRTVSETISVGQALLEVKDQLDHGQFGDWLKAEFGAEARTAQNFMASAREYGSKPEIVSDLPLTVVYKLASPSVPDDVRRKVEAKARGGEPLTANSVRQMIADGIEADRERRAKERDEERRSRLSEQQRKDEDRKAKSRDRSKAARAAAIQADNEAREMELQADFMAEARLALFIIKCAGPQRGKLVEMVASTRRHVHKTLRVALGGVSTNDLLYADREKAALDAVKGETPSDSVEDVTVLEAVWRNASLEARKQFVAWVQNWEKR